MPNSDHQHNYLFAACTPYVQVSHCYRCAQHVPPSIVIGMNLPTADYYGITDPEEAHRAIRKTRDAGPIARSPYGVEVLSYELVRSVLRDTRFVMPAGNGLAALGITAGPLWDRVSRSMVGTDGPAHQRLHRLVMPAFTPVVAQRIQTTCADMMDELIDPHAGSGNCDVVADIARPYPVPIIASLLGIPPSDWPRLSQWLRVISKVFSVRVHEHASAIETAWQVFDDYLDRIVTTARDDGLVATLRDSALDRDEVYTLIALLFMAGTDTVRNQLAAAVQVFADHPDQWALLAERPQLARAAVDEVMRYLPASISVIRTATEDVELGGVVIPKGSYVVVNTAAANRDPAAFDAPDRFDITRTSPPMLTFGGGPHRCIGAHLAKVELTEALHVLSRRMPGLRRVGPAPWRPIVGISGPRSLVVHFDRPRLSFGDQRQSQTR